MVSRCEVEKENARSLSQKRIWQMHRSRFQSSAHAAQRRGGRRFSHTVKFMETRGEFRDTEMEWNIFRLSRAPVCVCVYVKGIAAV